MKINISKNLKIGVFLSAITATTLLTANVSIDRKSDSSIKLSYDNEGSFEYDATNGWWWYKENIIDKEGKKHEVKEKMSVKEKLAHDSQNKLIRSIKEQTKVIKKQNKLMEKVKGRLEYAYPNITPIYTKNQKTGKKCLTNSSDDCFIFPLQAEAQHVPVLAGWLSNPNPTNSKKWLRWEAKYFNHLQKISLGNRYAFLSGGAEAYPTNTTFVYNDNLSTPVSIEAKSKREEVIIEKLGKKLTMKFFLGGNTLLENSTFAYKGMGDYIFDPFQKTNIKVYVPSEKMKQHILAKLPPIFTISHRAKTFWGKYEIEVSPEEFVKNNIFVTPSVVVNYKTDKNEDNKMGNKTIWQNITVGSVAYNKVLKATVQFLVYNNIINPSEMATSINLADKQKNVVAKDPTFKEDNIYKDINHFNNGDNNENKR